MMIRLFRILAAACVALLLPTRPLDAQESRPSHHARLSLGFGSHGFGGRLGVSLTRHLSIEGGWHGTLPSDRAVVSLGAPVTFTGSEAFGYVAPMAGATRCMNDLNRRRCADQDWHPHAAIRIGAGMFLDEERRWAVEASAGYLHHESFSNLEGHPFGALHFSRVVSF